MSCGVAWAKPAPSFPSQSRPWGLCRAPRGQWYEFSSYILDMALPLPVPGRTGGRALTAHFC